MKIRKECVPPHSNTHKISNEASMFLSPLATVGVDVQNISAVNPETLELANKLIDELQANTPKLPPKKRLPQVPVFPPQDRKMSALELLGSSDSEAVSEVDFAAFNAETSEDERSSEHSVEDLYSEHASESGESSGSNYESTSSFEARKAKRASKMRHGSATSKAAAAGRKQQMHIRCARALNKSPQSVYRKEKASASAAQKKNTHKKQQASSSESENKTQSSPSNSETESDESNKTSAPSRNKKASKGKQQKPTAEEKQAGTKPRKGVKLPHKVVNEDYEGSQEKGVPIVDSRPGKKKVKGWKAEKRD